MSLILTTYNDSFTSQSLPDVLYREFGLSLTYKAINNQQNQTQSLVFITTSGSNQISESVELAAYNFNIKLRDIISKILGIEENRIINLECKFDKHIGTYVEVVIDYPAKIVLELWIKNIDKLKCLDLPIILKWGRELDLEPLELGEYLGKIFAKLDLGITTTDVVSWSDELIYEE